MRALSILFALGAWVCSIFALLLGVAWGLGLKCDDACSSSRGWRGDPEAWQWTAIAVLGVVTFVAGCALVVFVWRRRPGWAAAAVAVGGAAALMVVNPITSTEWIDHLDRRSPIELLVMATAVFAPVLAVLFSIDPRDA